MVTAGPLAHLVAEFTVTVGVEDIVNDVEKFAVQFVVLFVTTTL